MPLTYPNYVDDSTQRTYHTNPDFSVIEGRAINRKHFGEKLDQSSSNLTFNKFSPPLKQHYQQQNIPTWWNDILKQWQELKNLDTDWDEYGAEPPTDFAIQWTKRILNILRYFNFRPSHVASCVEEGITIAFLVERKTAFIEVFNTNEIIAVISKGKDEDPHIWEVEHNLNSLQKAVEAIQNDLLHDA